MCGLDPRAAAVIRIDAIWLAVEPVDMRAGVDRFWRAWCRSSALPRSTMAISSPMHAHRASSFCARRLRRVVRGATPDQGGFEWPRLATADAVPVALSQDQFNALVLGLPWQRLEQLRAITRM